MKIAVTGATGFIGGALVGRLQRDGHTVYVLGRRPPEMGNVEFVRWDVQSEPAGLESVEAVLHLAGEKISQRWTSEAKRRIRESRTVGTRNLVSGIGKLQSKPRTLISVSGISYYGDRSDDILTETTPSGEGFLAEVCIAWEREALNAEQFGLRVVTPRIGMVLGRGGALKKMLPPFRMGVGGPLGSGKQWMSWIHLDDLVELFVFLLSHESVRGPVNAVAPNPVRNSEFTRALAAAVHRPAIIPVPKFGLKLLFGEMADVVMESQRVVPAVAQAAGFQFRYRDIGDALRASVYY
jgi:uncharacterized protein (TIGR01777 family)